MIIVKFNSVDEFLGELRKTKKCDFYPQPLVWPPIVRLTYLHKKSSLSPNIEHLFVISTFSLINWIDNDKFTEAIVKLEAFCGDTWNINGETNEKVRERAETMARQIEDACKELLYEVRNGVLEESGDG